MSDEQSMTIIENLSEELGEKELKIMALEKEVEEQKKQKLEYLELCEIKQYLIEFSKVAEYKEGCCPMDIISAWRVKSNTGALCDDYELMKKTILHFFGGSIMTKEEHIEDLDDSELRNVNLYDIINIEDGTYWVSD